MKKKLKASARIRMTLALKEAISEAGKFHDALILRWLKCLEKNANKESEEVADEFEKLDKEWKDFCERKHFAKEAFSVFHDQVQRIVADLHKQGSLQVVK